MTRRREDYDEEFAAHLDCKVRDLIAQGWPPESALAEARRQFGNAAAFRTQCAEATRPRADRTPAERLRTAAQDAWHAARSLRRSKGFALTALIAIAAGVGLTGAIVSVIDSILLRPLPYPAPHQLVMVWSAHPATGELSSHISAADFYDLEARELGTPGTQLFGFMSWPVTLTEVAEPERLEGALVTPAVFSTLGVHPAGGTGFDGVDEAALDQSVVISSRLASRLGLTTAPNGRTIRLNGQLVSVLGVMPEAFAFPTPTTDVWVPLVLRGDNRINRSSRWLKVIARLGEATRPEHAQSGAEAVAAALAETYPATNAGWTLRLSPFQEEVVGSTRPALLALAGAVLAMVLVTITNVSNFAFGRLVRRSAVFRVQLALGAGRARIVRQLFCEAVTLAVLGTVAGLVIAVGLVRLFQAWAPDSIPRVHDVQVTTFALLLSMIVGGLTAVGMFALPLCSRRWWSSLDGAVLRTRQLSEPGAHGQRVVVIAQTAVVTLLLAIAGTFGQAFVSLARTDLGFHPGGLLVMRLQWPRSQYSTPDAQQALLDQLLERVGSLGQIAHVAALSDLPVEGNSVSLPVTIDGRPAPSGEEPPRAGLRIVTANYLDLVQTPISRGRGFTADDRATSEPVAIVNETFAQRHWPGSDALGKRVRAGEDHDWRRIVGVVSDVRHAGPAADEGPAIYVPHTQKSETWLNWVWLTVRPQPGTGEVVRAIRAAVAQVDRNLPVSQVSTMQDMVSSAFALPRMNALVAGTTAGITLLLATLGVWAVLAQVVTHRRAEFALRMALGAPRSTIAFRPMRLGVGLVLAGWIAGSLGLFLVEGALRTQIQALPPLDISTWLASGGVLLIAAIVATITPLRTVLALDPIEVLRRE